MEKFFAGWGSPMPKASGEKMESRAMHEIKADAWKLIPKIQGAIEAESADSLYCLAERITEIAQRLAHHKSLETARMMGVGSHQEREAR